jgi:hypothetical protein
MLSTALKPFDRALASRQESSFSCAKRDYEITHRILSLLSQVRSILRARAPTGSPPGDQGQWTRRVPGPGRHPVGGSRSQLCALKRGQRVLSVRETIFRISSASMPNHFVRIHRSTIVNVRKIKELSVNSGEYVVVLKAEENSHSVAVAGCLQKSSRRFVSQPRTRLVVSASC